MPKAFIHLGAGISSILPLMDYSQNKKYKPILIDRSPINSVNSWFISKKLCLDLVEDIYAYVESMSKKFEIIGAYPVADYANDLAAAINKRYNPQVDNDTSIKFLRDKKKVNEIISGSGLRIPEPYSIQEKNIYDRKVIVKERYGNDSRGAFITNTNDPRLQQQVANGDLIIQSMVSGTLYNIDSIVYKGKAHILSLNMRLPCPNNQLVTRFTIQTNSIQSFISTSLEAYVNKIVNVLNYKNGPITIDCIVDEHGVATFLEASPFLHKPWLNKLGSSVSPFIEIADLYDSIKYNTNFTFNSYPSYVSFEYINYFNTMEELRSIKYLSALADDVYIDPAWSIRPNRKTDIKSVLLGKVNVKDLHKLVHAYNWLA